MGIEGILSKRDQNVDRLADRADLSYVGDRRVLLEGHYGHDANAIHPDAVLPGVLDRDPEGKQIDIVLDVILIPRKKRDVTGRQPDAPEGDTQLRQPFFGKR